MKKTLRKLRREWPLVALLATTTVGVPAFALAGAAVADGLGLENGGTASPAWTTDDPTAQLHGRCFPAAKWGGETTADDNTRPCVRVMRVYEDGSFKVAVQDADGPVRYSLGVGVPDAYECRTGAAPAAC